MPTISFRVTEKENKLIEKESTKTDYCKRLVLGYEVENLTTAQTINSLIDLWEEMRIKNIDKNILEKLKQIILNCKS